MKLKIKLLSLLFFSFPFVLNSVEERNPVPFFYLNAKPLKIVINPKSNRICRVKLKDLVEYKNIEVEECYPLGKKLSDSIKVIQSKNPNKNELNLMFVDETNKILSPELTTPEMSYSIKSIIYFKKTKLHQIELIDKNGLYYYFIYDPTQVGIGE